MKVFPIDQIKALDEYTIANEPIAPEALMLRASMLFADAFSAEVSPQCRVFLFAGPGNNGGDAKVIARLLAERGYDVSLQDVTQASSFPEIKTADVIVDGVFGAGINRPLSGKYAQVVKRMNESEARIYSIDIPSGLFGEDNAANDPASIVRAYKTFTFQAPKLSFFFSENEPYTGAWEVLDIRLHPEAIAQTETDYYYTTAEDVYPAIHSRNAFSHKGTFGHALIVAGSNGKMGAAVLAAKACLRSGAGLVTAHIPARGEVIMQTAFPEAMVECDTHADYISEVQPDALFDAIGIGPGLSVNELTDRALANLLKEAGQPLVIDADALNLIARSPELLALIPRNSLLTPHPKEFDRLAGASANSYERLQKARAFARRYHIYMVLKGAYTAVCCPCGKVRFNSTGNPGMATAGSGDVLTGILTGLLAQRYTPEEAAVTGVYLHGKAGDLAARSLSREGMIAGDLIHYLAKTFSYD